MKILARLGVVALAAGLLLTTGCSKPGIDVDKVRTALAGLPADQNALLEEALKDISVSNYEASLKPLRGLALRAKLNKDQAKVLEDTVIKARAEAAK